MPTKTVPTETPVEDTPKKKTYTNWSAFEKAKIVPTTIICDVIRGHEPSESCKSRLLLKSGSIVNHYHAGHGGGFQVKVKQTDGKPWPGWKELSDLGYEITSLQCVACDQQVEISARDILNHLRPHRGKFRGAYENYRDTFLMVVQDAPVTPLEDNDESFAEDSE